MGAVQSSTAELDHRKSLGAEEMADLDAPEVWPELDDFLENTQQLTKTNERLRELLTRLAVLVVGDIIDRAA